MIIYHTQYTNTIYKPFIVSTSVLCAGAHGKALGHTSYMDSQEVVRALTSVFPSPVTDQTEMRAASVVHGTRIINCTERSNRSAKYPNSQSRN